jgi:hypothetical protein
MPVLRKLKLPGAATGLVAGLVVGALAATGGAPTHFVVAASLGLGVPLAVFGIGYDLLLDAGRIRFGGIAPAAFYGVIVFPVARLAQELLLMGLFGQGITLQQESGVPQFLAFQAVMGFGYGVGFLMIHSQIMELGAWREYRKQQREKAPQTAGE